jgi:lysophospholipase L1-like esterase
MTDRRSLLKAGAACLGAAAVSDDCHGQSVRANPSDIAGYDYRLPGIPKGSRLLFLGDSITDMKWGRNEKDRNHYLGHSYVFLIAARLGVEMPEAGLEFFNRGISGNKVGDLRKRWQKDAIETNPDLLSILIGVNDISRGGGKPVPLEKWEEDYRYLLDTSREANPDLRIVLMDPFVLRVTRLDKDETWKRWRGEIDKLGAIVSRLAADYGALHIPLQQVFDAAAETAEPAHWIWDGVHPLPQGHELIARSWIERMG